MGSRVWESLFEAAQKAEDSGIFGRIRDRGVFAFRSADGEMYFCVISADPKRILVMRDGAEARRFAESTDIDEAGYAIEALSLLWSVEEDEDADYYMAWKAYCRARDIRGALQPVAERYTPMRTAARCNSAQIGLLTDAVYAAIDYEGESLTRRVFEDCPLIGGEIRVELPDYGRNYAVIEAPDEFTCMRVKKKQPAGMWLADVFTLPVALPNLGDLSDKDPINPAYNIPYAPGMARRYYTFFYVADYMGLSLLGGVMDEDIREAEQITKCFRTLLVQENRRPRVVYTRDDRATDMLRGICESCGIRIEMKKMDTIFDDLRDHVVSSFDMSAADEEYESRDFTRMYFEHLRSEGMREEEIEAKMAHVRLFSDVYIPEMIEAEKMPDMNAFAKEWLKQNAPDYDPAEVLGSILEFMRFVNSGRE